MSLPDRPAAGVRLLPGAKEIINELNARPVRLALLVRMRRIF
jgi:hypothetical protein